MYACAMDATEAGRLLSLISHELRTPVNVVDGYLRMVLSEKLGPVGDKQKQVLTQAGRSASRIASLLGDLSEMGRLEDGRAEWNAESVAIVPLIDEVVAAFTPPADFTCVATRAGDDIDVRIEADPARLARSLAACLQAVARTAPTASTIVATLGREAASGRPAIVVAPDSLDPADVARDAAGHPADEFVGGLGLEIPLARRVLARAGATLEGIPGGHRGLRIVFDAS